MSIIQISSGMMAYRVYRGKFDQSLMARRCKDSLGFVDAACLKELVNLVIGEQAGLR